MTKLYSATNNKIFEKLISKSQTEQKTIDQKLTQRHNINRKPRVKQKIDSKQMQFQ